MNVMRASSLQKQSQNNKKDTNFCPLLHLVTLITTFQAKKIPSLQQKIDENLKQLSTINISQINMSSFMGLLQSYHSHLEGSQNVKRLVQILCEKLNKNTNTQILIDLLQILAKQYHFRGEKDKQIRVLFQVFQLGLEMKRKQFKTFNSGVRACELMTQKQFQRNVNNVILAIKNQIQSNTQTLTRNISLASQVYGCKLTTKQDNKSAYKQNKNQYMKKLIQRSSSYQKNNFSQYRPSSPDMRLTHQDQYNKDFNKSAAFQNSASHEFTQKQGNQRLLQSSKPSKLIHSKTVHRSSQNDIAMKIKTKIKSKSQLLPFYVLLYEVYTICLLRINSQLKKKYYNEARAELKDKIIREYPGRNVEQVLFQIELDKMKIYEAKQQKKQPIKMFSPSNSLRKSKLLSSSTGKLNSNLSNSPANKGLKQNKSTFSYQINEFEQLSQSKFVENNSQVMGVKIRPKISKFSNIQKESNEEEMKILQQKSKVQQKKQSSRKDINNLLDSTNKQTNRQRKSSLHIRSRILSSSKSEQRQSKKQITNNQDKNSNADSDKKPLIYNISRIKKDEKKSNILDRLKLNQNKDKVNLKKKAKKLIPQKNFLKFNDFTKSSNQSQRNSLVNEEIKDDKDENKDEVKQIVDDEVEKVVKNEIEESKRQQKIQQINIVEDNDVEQQLLTNQVEEVPTKQIQQVQTQQIQEFSQRKQTIKDIPTFEKEQLSQIHQTIEHTIQYQKHDEFQIEQKKSVEVIQSKRQQQTQQQQQTFKASYQVVEQENCNDLTQVVTEYLENQLQENIITEILKQQEIKLLQQQKKLKELKIKQQQKVDALLNVKNNQQKQQKTQYIFSQQIQQQKPQVSNIIISDRRIPLCDLSYEQQQTSQKQEQTVYEIMIKDTPMNGHDLYSSTSRSVSKLEQNSSILHETKLQQDFVIDKKIEEQMTESKNRVDLLQVPLGSDSQQDFIEQRRINGSNFMENQIQALHGFGQIRQMQISVLNCDQQQNSIMQQVQNEQIRGYLCRIQDVVVRDCEVLDDKISSYQCQLVDRDEINKIEGIYSNDKPIRQNQDVDISHLVKQYLQSFQQTYNNKQAQRFMLDNIIDETNQQQHKHPIPSQQNSHHSSSRSSSSRSSQSYFSKSNQSLKQQQSHPRLQQQKHKQQQYNVVHVYQNKKTSQQQLIHKYIDSDQNLNYLQSNNFDADLQSISNNKYSDQILTIQNNICSLLNATNIQYSQTSKLNITEFSPVMPQRKFPPSSEKSHKQEISILANNQEILNIRPSIQDDLVDMAELVKRNFINSNHLLGSNISIDIDTKKSAIKSIPKINISENNINNNAQSKQKRENSNGSKKSKNVQISLMPRQQTIESNISSNQQSHSIIIAHHLLKPQIHITDTLVRLIVFHPEEKKTCQVEKLFLQPINVKDYMKGLQARITKFLDKLVNEAKQHQKPSMLQSRSSMLHSARLNSQSLKRSKKQQQLQRSRVDDLINHGHHPFNWQYIVENINRVNLQQQLFNLKSFQIPYKKDQYLTLSLMHYVDYKRLIVEYKKNPLQLRPVQISLDLNESLNQITTLFNETNTKILLTQFNNEIKPILQVYNLWCHLQTLAISLKNSTSRLKSLFKLNQFVFKNSQNINKYNMLIQMIHSQHDKENLVISDMNLHDRNKLDMRLKLIVVSPSLLLVANKLKPFQACYDCDFQMDGFSCFGLLIQIFLKLIKFTKVSFFS